MNNITAVQNAVSTRQLMVKLKAIRSGKPTCRVSKKLLSDLLTKLGIPS